MVKIRVTFPAIVTLLLVFSRRVLTMMRASPYFQNPSPELAACLEKLEELIEKLEAAYNAAVNRDKERIRERVVVEKEIKAVLLKIARLVELTADGDATVMRSSGFEVSDQKPVRNKYTGKLPAPGVALYHGPERGSLWAKVTKAVPGAGSYDCRYTDGNSNDIESYQEHGVFRRGRILIPGLKSGTDYAVIIRCIGPDGPGHWSKPITLMPL